MATEAHEHQRPLPTDLDAPLAAHGDHTYREFLRVPALSLGLFAAPPGQTGTPT